MAGEYIQSKSLKEYWEKLKSIYQERSTFFHEISKEAYEKIAKSDREDSDNHLNQQRLGTDTDVVDITFYKYLENRKIAYHTIVIDVQGNQEEYFFELIPKVEGQV